MRINLIGGALEINDNIDGWIITSKTATVEGAEDLTLLYGDRITINGDVFRGDEFIGNISYD